MPYATNNILLGSGVAANRKDVNVYPQDKNFEEIINYLKKRNAVELEKISDGKNPEVEKRYDRYVDYG